MDNIRIQWLSDSYECDTCGYDWAQGAYIYLNEELKVELVPVAHCFSGINYDEAAVYRAALNLVCELTEDEL